MTPIDPAREALLDAILTHVPFDGWSEAAFAVAIRDTGMDRAEAMALCPRGPLDLAILHHRRGDLRMREALQKEPLSDLKIREKIARAIRLRLDAIDDKEAVRRGSALFALPHNAPEGAKLLWGTADAMWDAIGDPSDDFNWYSKRATLSGVYASVVLYWLGDDSLDHQATDAFIDRRIENVMQIEKLKASVRQNPVLSRLLQPAEAILSRVRPPAKMPPVDLPGHWTDPTAPGGRSDG